MKTLVLEQSTLAGCVEAARNDRVVILRNGKPLALVVNVEGMDTEQLQLGSSNSC